MRSATLVDATDLVRWADRRDAQDTLPRLVRRLVFVTVERVLRAEFRAGEGVQLGGWDGLVAVEHGNAFVPDGTSAWELGTGKNIKAKADHDYKERTKKPHGVNQAETTFVFVTPRRWTGGKDKWATQRRQEGKWADVRALDADDLETWLETAPPVHTWLSLLLGKHPEGAIDLDSYWADWSYVTQPPTSPEFVLSGRAGTAKSIVQWLKGTAPSLILRGESRDEALAIFAAAVQQLPDEERESVVARSAVVSKAAAWDQMVATDKPLVLIPRFDVAEAVSRATRSGHRVVVTLGRADSTSEHAIVVPRLSTADAAKALEAAGIPEEKASGLAALARRSLTSYRRRLATNPALQQPQWACPAEGPRLLPALLAGAWNGVNDADRQVLAALANEQYDHLQQTLVRWANEEDPPVRKVGNAWCVASKEDAWSLLSRYLSSDNLERFEATALNILGAPDPALEMPEDERWLAGIKGQVPKHSELLRKGFADALAMIGARGGEVPVATGTTAGDYAKLIVRRLLGLANADWKVWASLSSSLPLLAEAAPDSFLGAVDAGLSGEHPVLLKLFTDKELGPLGPSSPHTGLLWALETLAWSPEYLGRAALCLAKLARLDPGGKLGNRPQSSLRHIFLPWLPQTSANLVQRLVVLDLMRKREPIVGWRLMHQLLPQRHGIGEHTPTPRWHDWAPDAMRRRSQTEYLHAVKEITARMLDDVNKHGNRWQDLIDALDRLPPEQHQSVVRRLEALDPAGLNPNDRAAIWSSLRQLLSVHRSFPDADWVLRRDQLDRLGEIYGRFEPQNALSRYGWLFGDVSALPDGHRADSNGLVEVEKAQLEAITAFYKDGGLVGVLEIADNVGRPGVLGAVLGQSGLAADKEDTFLHENLASDAPKLALFAQGYATACVNSGGREWVEAKLSGAAREWTPAQRAKLLVCLPCDQRTWELAKGQGPETEREYWQLVRPFEARGTEVEHAARKFLEHGRPYAAFEALAGQAMLKRPLSAGLAAETLEQVLKAWDSDRIPNSFSYMLSHLLNVLSASSDIDESRVARLEWAYLPVMGHHGRPPKLLHRELSRKPEFFVDLVCWAFKAEDEPPRDLSDEDLARGHLTHELLQSWRAVPGTSDDTEIDPKALLDWVSRARTGLAEKRRGPIGDEQIGEVLSGSPHGSDGAWPHPAVRDVVETVRSTDMERGLEVGLYNSRGVVMKDPAEGGKQEKELAARYDGYAATVSNRWPRTAAMLRRIADTYNREALGADQNTELQEDLNR